MRLECEADKRAWADVVDVWTRRMLSEFGDLLMAALRGEEGADDKVKEFYRCTVKDASITDADGAEYRGLDAILDVQAGSGMDNVDAAVASFWGNLPYQAYRARQSLGNAKRVG